MKRILSTTPTDKSRCNLDRRTVKRSKGVRFRLSTEEENIQEKPDGGALSLEEVLTSRSHELLSGKQHDLAAIDILNVKSLRDFAKTVPGRRTICHRLGTTLSIILATPDRQVTGTVVNRAIKPTSLVVKRDTANSISHDAADSLAYTPTRAPIPFSTTDKYNPNIENRLDQKLWLLPSAVTTKIHTSVVTIGSDGSAVLTTRITPSTHGTFLPQYRTASGPFQISVIQGQSGLGIEVASTPVGTIITRIADSGPVGRNGYVRYDLFSSVLQ